MFFQHNAIVQDGIIYGKISKTAYQQRKESAEDAQGCDPEGHFHLTFVLQINQANTLPNIIATNEAIKAISKEFPNGL